MKSNTELHSQQYLPRNDIEVCVMSSNTSLLESFLLVIGKWVLLSHAMLLCLNIFEKKAALHGTTKPIHQLTRGVRI